MEAIILKSQTTKDDAKRAILDGIARGTDLKLDPISDYETFEMYQEAYDELVATLLAGRTEEEVSQIQVYATRNRLNEVI